MSGRFAMRFAAQPGHIDELGHVNNAVWVQWVQEIATAHWAAVAAAAHQAAYAWVVVRHEIDYRGNIGPGESVTAQTFIPAPPSGARFDRCVEFRDARGAVVVRARTTWAMLDRARGRIVRVPPAVAAPFLPAAAPVSAPASAPALAKPPAGAADAVIIAAGYGSRLAALSPSKPLTPIAGVPLLELGVRQARAAGVRRVVVVTGHEAARVEAFLALLAARLDLAIEPRRVADWSRSNGWSVLAGAEACAGDYLLMMADHLFDASILADLRAAAAPDRGVTLAIDRRCDNPLVDPDDATWVRTGAGGAITAIGKAIVPYDAVDCGAFLATPELAAAIRAAIAAGAAGSLSDGMQRLADARRAATLEIGARWWLDVDDPRAHALAEAEAPQRLAAAFAAARAAAQG